MHIRFIIIIFVLFPTLIQAQAFQIDKPPLPIDSLKRILPLLHDSARVDCLNELARSYTEEEVPRLFDSAWLLVQQAYTEASSINYIKGLGDACFRYGHLSEWYLWDSKKMEKYYSEAIFWYKKIQDDDGLGHAFKGLGQALLNQGAVDEAKEAFEQSAFHFQKTGNRVMLVELSDCLGDIYNANGDFEKYFESIKQGLREKKRIGDNRGMIRSFYRLAHIYQSVGDFETALDYFRQSFRQASSQAIPWHPYKSMGDIFLYLKNYDSSIYYFQKVFERLPAHGATLAGIGKLYMLRHEYSKALDYLQNAIITFKRKSNDGGIMWAKVDMGKSYIGLGQYSEALRCARDALTIAWRIDSKDAMQYAYEIHWNVYKALQQTDSAYFYLQKFVPLKDSLKDARLRLQNLQKLVLYKVEAKEEQQQARIKLLHKDNQITQQKLQKESLQKRVLTGGFIALFLLSIIILRNITLKRRYEKLQSERKQAEMQQQATELEMQALRAQMNPHFIFNSLNSINRFILKKQSSEATAYLTKFSRLIRMILNSSANATVSLTEELEVLQLYMELESLRFDQKFTYKIECDPEIDADFIKVPPMLLLPYIENAIWHGLMHKVGEGNLWINIYQEESKLICTITDDGIGRKMATELKSKSANAHKSMGMRITADRIALWQQQKQLDTYIKITDLVLPDGSAGGTEVSIQIPVAYD